MDRLFFCALARAGRNGHFQTFFIFLQAPQYFTILAEVNHFFKEIFMIFEEIKANINEIIC